MWKKDLIKEHHQKEKNRILDNIISIEMIEVLLHCLREIQWSFDLSWKVAVI